MRLIDADKLIEDLKDFTTSTDDGVVESPMTLSIVSYCKGRFIEKVNAQSTVGVGMEVGE